MNVIVEECEGCQYSYADRCPRYRVPGAFRRTNGTFMCPSKGMAVQAKKEKVRVGQQKQRKVK